MVKLLISCNKTYHRQKVVEAETKEEALAIFRKMMSENPINEDDLTSESENIQKWF